MTNKLFGIKSIACMLFAAGFSFLLTMCSNDVANDMPVEVKLDQTAKLISFASSREFILGPVMHFDSYKSIDSNGHEINYSPVLYREDTSTGKYIEAYSKIKSYKHFGSVANSIIQDSAVIGIKYYNVLYDIQFGDTKPLKVHADSLMQDFSKNYFEMFSARLNVNGMYLESPFVRGYPDRNGTYILQGRINDTLGMGEYKLRPGASFKIDYGPEGFNINFY